MDVNFIDMYLMSVHIVGVYLIGVYLTGMNLIDIDTPPYVTVAHRIGQHHSWRKFSTLTN
jgi:hypothetical protein